MLKVLSLGAGVQSSTLLLMACKGLIEKPDVAIFADTGWERKVTYGHLKWLTSEAAKAGIPVVTVQERNVRDDSLNAAELNKGYYFMPVFMTKNGGNLMMSRRLCTDRYKLIPIRKQIRNWLQVKPKQRIPEDAVNIQMGISLDEAKRMSLPSAKWYFNSFPLVDMLMTRNDCIKWLRDNYNGLNVIKSACIGCPFHSNKEWRSIYDSAYEWDDALLVDETIRHGVAATKDYIQYLHSSGRPLREVDLRTPEDKGQLYMPFYAKEEKLKLFATTNVLWIPDD